ncbi:DUF3973 domain-containing protein [Robertmurraya sp.]|uniref:DUF3973 domain-containing protein n=1 Tax=Robertmurraya sp. TaxID=2837525 RepID=UPI0037041DE2
MYFCLKCEGYHEDFTAEKIFETGFRSDLITKEKVQVGICDKNKLSTTSDAQK